MKKIILVFVLLSLFQLPAVFAQQNTANSGSEYYYVNVPIDRIFPHRLGYIVEYRSGWGQTFRTYIPREWFGGGTVDKGEMITLRPGTTWPSMTVFYERGEFSHVKLRVRERSHQSWSLIPPGVGAQLDEHFRNITEIRLRF